MSTSSQPTVEELFRRNMTVADARDQHGKIIGKDIHLFFPDDEWSKFEHLFPIGYKPREPEVFSKAWWDKNGPEMRRRYGLEGKGTW